MQSVGVPPGIAGLNPDRMRTQEFVRACGRGQHQRAIAGGDQRPFQRHQVHAVGPWHDVQHVIGKVTGHGTREVMLEYQLNRLPASGAVTLVDFPGDPFVALPLGREPRDTLPRGHELRHVHHIARDTGPAQQHLVGVHGLRERLHRIDSLGPEDQCAVTDAAAQRGRELAGLGAAGGAPDMIGGWRNRVARHPYHAAVRQVHKLGVLIHPQAEESLTALEKTAPVHRQLEADHVVTQ